MATGAINFSDLGAKPVSTPSPSGKIDLSDLGAQEVQSPSVASRPAAQPGAFQTMPGGRVYNANDLHNESILYPSVSAAISGAKARVKMPDYPDQLQRSMQTEAEDLPATAAAVFGMGGPASAGLGAAAGVLAKPLLTGEPADLNEAATEGAKTGLAAYALQEAPAAISKGAGKVLDLFDARQGVSEAEAEWRAINAAIKVKPNQVRMPLGASDMSDAYSIPGRSVAQKVGVSASDLASMNPFQQGAKIAPAWQQAGAQVSSVADAATKNGVTLDLGKALLDGLGRIDNPEVQNRAFDVVTDTAHNIGLDSWSKATPNDALQLRRALWDALPRGYRAPIYGQITGNLKAAVPDIAAPDQAYSELSAAMEATKTAAQKFAVSAPSSPAARIAKRMAPQIIRGAATAAGAGLIGAGAVEAIKGLRSGQ